MIKHLFRVSMALIIISMLFPSALFALTGGPDEFGYTFYDSNEEGVTEFSWIEIQNTGSQLTLSNDSVSGAIPVGFDFYFYGKKYSDVYISSNGFIGFNSDMQDGCCEGSSIPSADSINNIIAAVWTDLDPSG